MRKPRGRPCGKIACVSEDRQLGVDLFNATWRLIESRADDDLMVDMAHASAYHWSVAPECEPANRGRSEWLLARVYCVVGRAEPAAHHARRCLEICLQNDLRDWDLGFAYEALARASRLAGDDTAAVKYVEEAKTVEIADPEDRAHLESDLATV
jgi:hypothetical protein